MLQNKQTKNIFKKSIKWRRNSLLTILP